MTPGDKTPTKKRYTRVPRTPVHVALRPESSLQHHVKDGLGAVKDGHRAFIEDSLRPEFGDSLNLDEALCAGHEQENRWDYMLGYSPSAAVIGLEPHTAKTDEISTVIAKRQAARDQLQSHLKSKAHVASWFWVASGKVHFADTEKARRRLDQNGIQFVGTRLLRKHFAK